MIKFSIIMPVYNSEKVLEKSISSIINQTYKNWELIIVDDGSTDESLEILKRYAGKCTRIKVYQQKNSGPGAARNKGISKANGDYIAFIDADDYFDLNYLSVVNSKIENCVADLIFINTVNEQPNGKVDYCDNIHKYASYEKKELLSMQMTGMIPWGPCSKIVKSDIVKPHKFSNLKVGEEIIYSFNVLRDSKKIIFIEKPLYHYVHNENGQHKKGGIDPWRQVVDTMKEHLISIGEFEEYFDAINSLTIKSLNICIYRISCSNSFLKGKKRIKEMVEIYKESYDLDSYNSKYLDKKTIIIYKILNLKLYFILIFISKIRKKFYK